MDLIGCLVFWKYYREKLGPERDLKLISLGKYLITSNFVVFSALMFLTFFMFVNTVSPVPFLIVVAIGGIWHFIFQFREFFSAAKRDSGIDESESLSDVLGEGFKIAALFAGALALGTAAEIAKGLGNFIEELFGDYEDKNNHQEQRYQEQDSQNKTTDNSNYNDDKFKSILMKYDLSWDSDMATIKKRFRSLAKKYHPDMPTGDEKRFIELREDLLFFKEYTELKANA